MASFLAKSANLLDNPSQKSVILNSSVKPIQQTKLGLVKIQDPRTLEGYKQKLFTVHYSQDSPLLKYEIQNDELTPYFVK